MSLFLSLTSPENGNYLLRSWLEIIEYCKICQNDEEKKIGKYKCPTCFIKYCSLVCWNEHTKINCVKPADKMEIQTNMESSSTTTEYLFPTDDTVQPLVLQKLGHSEKLKSSLENPHLCKMILEVDKAPKVKPLIQEAMLDPIFVEFADACLEIVEPSTDDLQSGSRQLSD